MLNPTEKALKEEDEMRRGAKGTAGQQVMKDADEARIADLEKSQDKTRATISGASDKMSTDAVGDTVGKRVRDAYQKADDAVDKAYAKAFDPQAQAAAGVAPEVDIKLVKDLPNQVTGSLIDGNQIFAITKEGTPKSFQIKEMLNDWAKTGRLPTEIFPGEVMAPGGGVSWQSVDWMRKYINGLRKQAEAAARASGDWTDFGGVNRMLQTFDSEFGKSNALLNDARAAHADMMGKFHPNAKNSAAGVVDTMRKLLNENNVGNTNFNTLFGEGKLTGGAQQGVFDHLKKVVGSDPEAMTAMKEGMLHNLFYSPDNVRLSPRKTATALQKGLEGRREGAFSSLFNDDDLAALSRHHDLTDIVDKSVVVKQPSKTSYKLIDKGTELVKKLVGAGVAGALGYSGAHKFGIDPTLLASMTGFGGYALGDVFGGARAGSRARTLVNPAMTPPGPPLSQIGALGVLGRSPEQEPPPNYAHGGYLRTLER